MRALLLGLTLALCGIGHRSGSPLFPRRGPGPAAWWVADRGADRLWVLDEDLLPLQVFTVRAPVAVARSDRGVWVAEAVEGDPLGRHHLRLFQGTGPASEALAVPPLRDLVSTEHGPVALTRAGLLLGVRGARLVPLARVEGARAVLGAGRCLWVADGGGQVLVLGAERGELLAAYDLGRPVVDLARASDGGAWALDDGGGLQRVGVAGRRQLGLTAPRVAAGWVLDHDSSRLERLRDGRRVRLDPSLAGLESAVAMPGGGLLVVSPGSLHLLDAEGQRRFAQGGFGYAVSVARAAGFAPR